MVTSVSEASTSCPLADHFCCPPREPALHCRGESYLVLGVGDFAGGLKVKRKTCIAYGVAKQGTDLTLNIPTLPSPFSFPSSGLPSRALCPLQHPGFCSDWFFLPSSCFSLLCSNSSVPSQTKYTHINTTKRVCVPTCVPVFSCRAAWSLRRRGEEHFGAHFYLQPHLLLQVMQFPF